jgi:hypothetical protein
VNQPVEHPVENAATHLIYAAMLQAEMKTSNIDKFAISLNYGDLLPEEIWILIWRYNPIRMLKRCMLVCSRWSRLACRFATDFLISPLPSDDILCRFNSFETIEIGVTNNSLRALSRRALSRYASPKNSRGRFLDDNGLRSLSNLVDLQLNYDVDISDHGISCLTKLENLSMDYNKSITDEGLYLLTGLKRLWISGVETITNRSLSRLSNLTVLSLDVNKTITDDGIRPLTNLTCLSLIGNNTITDAAIRDFDSHTGPFSHCLDNGVKHYHRR